MSLFQQVYEIYKLPVDVNFWCAFLCKIAQDNAVIKTDCLCYIASMLIFSNEHWGKYDI